MADKGRFLAVTSILLSLLPVIAAYQCHGVLLCYLLISRKRQQVAMLNAANRDVFMILANKVRPLSFEPSRGPRGDEYGNFSISSTLSSDHTHFVYFFSLSFFWIKSESLDTFRFFPPDCESLFLSSPDV